MENFKISSTVTDDSGEPGLNMVFEGTLTLTNSKEIKETLEKQKQDYSKIALTVKNVAGLDVSFLQIIESYRRSIEENGGRVKISMDLPYDLKTLLSNAGISYPAK